jgi:hypothetical protein
LGATVAELKFQASEGRRFTIYSRPGSYTFTADFLSSHAAGMPVLQIIDDSECNSNNKRYRVSDETFVGESSNGESQVQMVRIRWFLTSNVGGTPLFGNQK